MDYLEAPFTADFFIIDRSLARISYDVEISDSSLLLSNIEISIDPEVVIVSYYAQPTKKPTGKIPLDERRYNPLLSVQPLYDYRAKVIITYTSSTLDACEMYVQPVEKSITSLALRLR
jgi:hypothetical protein